MMKIAFLIDNLGMGGAQRQLLNLAIELKLRGHRVSIFHYYPDDFYISLLSGSGIVPTLIETKGKIERVFKIRKVIRFENPDVLISFMGVPNFFASVASMGKHNWKFIASERIANENLFSSGKAKFFRKFVSKYADVICCNSKSAEALWARYFPKTKEKLCTIYNIVEEPKSDAVRDEDGKIRFVVAARVEREKNLSGLIQAIASLSESEKEIFELHWYGRPQPGENLLEESNEQIKDFSLEKQIIIHPSTDRIHDEMAKADFVSLFSFMEGLPNAILEGMALKKPIVMSKVSDYAVLVNEENGFLCDPADPADIAKAIRAALGTTTEQRTEMGEKSYEKLLSICSKDMIVRKWLELIES